MRLPRRLPFGRLLAMTSIPDMMTIMSDDFKGKVVLITGAGKGYGRALAEAFAARGACVAANDISPVNLDPLVAQPNGLIKAYVEDVAKKVGAQAVVKQAEDDFGKIDILINHAAVEPRVSLLDMDEWDWHRVLDVNLTGAFLMMARAIAMRWRCPPDSFTPRSPTLVS